MAIAKANAVALLGAVASRTFLASASSLTFTAIPGQSPQVLQGRADAVTAYLESYISSTCGLDVDVIYNGVETYDDAVDALLDKAADFGWYGGLTGVQAGLKSPPATYLAQRIEDRQFTSVFIQSPDIETLTSIEGVQNRSLSYGSDQSTSGHLMPAFYLSEANVTPSSTQFTGSHDATVDAVINGETEVGALNSVTWQTRLDAGTTNGTSVFYTTPEFADYLWVSGAGIVDTWGNVLSGATNDVPQECDDVNKLLTSAFLAAEAEDPLADAMMKSYSTKGYVAIQPGEYNPIEETGCKLGLIEEKYCNEPVPDNLGNVVGTASNTTASPTKAEAWNESLSWSVYQSIDDCTAGKDEGVEYSGKTVSLRLGLDDAALCEADALNENGTATTIYTKWEPVNCGSDVFEARVYTNCDADCASCDEETDGSWFVKGTKSELKEVYEKVDKCFYVTDANGTTSDFQAFDASVALDDSQSYWRTVLTNVCSDDWFDEFILSESLEGQANEEEKLAGRCGFCSAGLTADADTPLPAGSDGVSYTCGQLAEFAGLFDSDDDDCKEILLAEPVCCPKPCGFCSAGITNDADTSLPVASDGVSYTCGQLAEFVDLYNSGSDECNEMLLAEPVCCPKSEPCAFCSKGLTADAETSLPVAPDGNSYTCGEHYTTTKYYVSSGSDECNDMLMVEPLCCPSSNSETSTLDEDESTDTATDSSGPCGFCSKGLTVDAETSLPVAPDGVTYTCGQLYGVVNFVKSGSDECNDMLMAEPLCCPSSSSEEDTTEPISDPNQDAVQSDPANVSEGAVDTNEDSNASSLSAVSLASILCIAIACMLTY